MSTRRLKMYTREYLDERLSEPLGEDWREAALYFATGHS